MSQGPASTLVCHSSRGVVCRGAILSDVIEWTADWIRTIGAGAAPKPKRLPANGGDITPLSFLTVPQLIKPNHTDRGQEPPL